MDTTILKLLQLEDEKRIDSTNKNKLNTRLQMLYNKFNHDKWRNNNSATVMQALHKADHIINNKQALETYMREGTSAFRSMRKGCLYVNWNKIKDATDIIKRELATGEDTAKRTTPIGERHSIKQSITEILTGLTIEKHRLRKNDVKFLIKTTDYELPKGVWVSTEEAEKQPQALRNYMRWLTVTKPRSLKPLINKHHTLIKYICKLNK